MYKAGERVVVMGSKATVVREVNSSPNRKWYRVQYDSGVQTTVSEDYMMTEMN